MLTEKRLAELKKLAESDSRLKRYVKESIEAADKCVGEKPLEHRLIGPRLLQVSRECLRRTHALGLAWRWTGDEKYPRTLKENLLTVCDFKDWNPSHFLDVAEMSHAVGVGYDWLYDYLDPETRGKIRLKLLELGLKPGLAAYEKKVWWASSEFNWNQVCNSGLAIGALAIAETDQEVARTILSNAVTSLPKAIATYDPDGAWGEGPGYWNYATIYTAYGLAAFQTALGRDFGLGETKGLRRAGFFPLYCAGPTGLYVNYADAGERSSLRPASVLMWLASRYQEPSLAAAQHRLLEKAAAGPLDVIWYVPADPSQLPKMSLDKKFAGDVELALFRSDWNDPDALLASIKAGFNQVNHGHLDLGTFEIDALGQRWARDLGSDDYNLPGYWEKQQGGKRWEYYRLGSFSHNVITLNGLQQSTLGKASMTSFREGTDRPHAIVEMSSAYKPAAAAVRRGLALVGDRKAVLIQDELSLTKTSDVAWGMTTDAEIAVNGSVATLSLGGKKMMARILAPAGAEFAAATAEQKAPQAANKGVRRLVIELKQQTGDLRLAVLLSPIWAQDKEIKSADVRTLEQWDKQVSSGP